MRSIMSAYNLSPLTSISGQFLQTLRGSPDYLNQSTDLLRHALDFDFHLATITQGIIENGGTNYYLDDRKLDSQRAYEVFSRIRRQKTEIEASFPHLFHAASLLDYTCHMTVNVLPMLRRNPRLFARLDSEGTLTFPWATQNGHEYSLAVYLGLSPFPIFLKDLNTSNPKTTAALSPFGLGVYAYLAYIVIPELSLIGIPDDLRQQFNARPIANGNLQKETDGSLRIRS